MSREDNRWSAGCGESRMSGVKWGKGGDNIKTLPITIGGKTLLLCPDWLYLV